MPDNRPCPNCGGHMKATGTHDKKGKLIQWREDCVKCGYCREEAQYGDK